MNGKSAKRLRRMAMGLAVSLNEAGKDIKKDGYMVKEHKNTFSSPSVSSSSLVGTPVGEGTVSASAPAPVAPTYQLFVRPDSVKSIYKKLKSGRI